MSESNESLLIRLKEEISRSDKAKAQIKAKSRRSFLIWMESKLVEIGKELGYGIIRIPQKVGKTIYKWIFD